MSTLARHTLRAAAVRATGPAEILDVVNTVLVQADTDRYLTAVVVHLRRDGDGWRTATSIAGHPLPYLVRNGTASPYGRYGPLVGVFEDASYHDIDGRLEAGDALVLYTDGVTEARDAERRFFGDEGIVRSLSAAVEPERMAAALLADVLAFQGGAATDDTAILVLAASAA